MKLLIGIPFCLITTICQTFYVEFTPLKEKLNTNSQDNFTPIINLANEIDKDQRIIKIIESFGNQKKSATYKDIYKIQLLKSLLDELGFKDLEKKAEYVYPLLSYAKTLSELRKLPAASAGCLIDTEWILGAKHVLDAAFANQHGYLIAPYGKHAIGQVKEVYACPVGIGDLALARMYEPFVAIPPVKRYRDKLKMEDEFYAYSDTLHSANGGISVEGLEIFGECKPVQGSNLDNKNITFNFNFDPESTFIIRTYGGDSGGPLFIKVSSTGDPLKDYQIIGVFNPGVKNLAVMNITNQEVNSWIDNVILRCALGIGPKPSLSRE